jgi:hypothetical protein
MMLNQEDRHSGLLQLAYHRSESADLFGNKACGGLVEKQHARPNGQGSRDFEQPSMSVGERICRHLLKVRDSEQMQQSARFL